MWFESCPARVTIPSAPPKPEPVKGAPAETPKPEAPAPAPPIEPEATGEEPTAEQVGLEVLSEVLRLMGVRATVETQLGYELADEDEEPPLLPELDVDFCLAFFFS